VICGAAGKRKPASIFPAEQYVNIWPAHKHDIFLSRRHGHCSGKKKASARNQRTPYILPSSCGLGSRGTGRQAASIHIDHGEANIQGTLYRWVRNNLMLASSLFLPGRLDGRAHRFARTEFIETDAIGSMSLFYHTQGTVNVLNLVEGEERVESSTAAFLHSSCIRETFIVPAAVGHIPFASWPSIGSSAHDQAVCVRQAKE